MGRATQRQPARAPKSMAIIRQREREGEGDKKRKKENEVSN